MTWRGPCDQKSNYKRTFVYFIETYFGQYVVKHNLFWNRNEWAEVEKVYFWNQADKTKNDELDDETNSIFTVSRKICIQISLENINTVL